MTGEVAGTSTPAYSFVPMREDDTPMLRSWLLEPHVRRWWDDDPEEHDYPEGTIRDWMEAIRGQDPTDMFVIQLDGRPNGVIQSYRIDDHPDYLVQLGGLPEPAFGVDIFIADRALIGKGHGPALLREFLRFASDRYGLDYCVIGPTKTNVAAIRAYEKAGFRYLKEYREDDTRDPPHVLLEIHRRDLA